MKWNGVVNRWIGAILDNDGVEAVPMPEIPDVVEQARQEWLNAQNYYNSVSDSDLVDHAVYMMQAAEKKYMYLLKKARQEGITYSPYMINREEMDNRIGL
ncbi:MAG: YaaL family protein [Negativicutes bacterium]|nr:YaaL family protein [Negativicutes bacterium]